jgi:uncharacterized protein YhbP (UPF0306 family)
VSNNLQSIEKFIKQHHVLSLATSADDEISVCSLFYAYSESEQSFIVASSKETNHIRHIQSNNKIAGNILLETKEVGKIQGVQFKGVFEELENKEDAKLYFQEFPYAKVIQPTLWKIKVEYFKMTDNKLGFSKKIIWQA